MHEIEPEDLMRFLRHITGGEERVRDKELAKLSPEDTAEKEALCSQLTAWANQVEDMKLAKREIDLANDKWWKKVRRKHNLGEDNLTYEGGVIYKLVDKDEKEKED